TQEDARHRVAVARERRLDLARFLGQDDGPHDVALALAEDCGRGAGRHRELLPRDLPRRLEGGESEDVAGLAGPFASGGAFAPVEGGGVLLREVGAEG